MPAKTLRIHFNHLTTTNHGRITGDRKLCFVCAVKLALSLDAGDRDENLFIESFTGKGGPCDECGRPLNDRLYIESVTPKTFRVVAA